MIRIQPGQWLTNGPDTYEILSVQNMIVKAKYNGKTTVEVSEKTVEKLIEEKRFTLTNSKPQ